MDVFGPLNRTKAGNKYILVLMDYATKWLEAIKLRNVTKETIVNCIIEVTARIGVPQELLTDNTLVLSRSESPLTILRQIIWWSALMPP